MYRKADGEIGLGPFTMETRKKMLYKLLSLQKQTNLPLIKMEELRYIDYLWDTEGDLTRRCLVDIYFKVYGEKLPWDDYKTPVFPEDIIKEIKQHCEEGKVEFELISKLIIEIDSNKNYTRGSAVTKAFDRIMNQGWLHFYTIEKGLKNEDQ
jgi:DNA sulfur modification protein DndC